MAASINRLYNIQGHISVVVPACYIFAISAGASPINRVVSVSVYLHLVLESLVRAESSGHGGGNNGVMHT